MGAPRPISNQPQYSLLVRHIERGWMAAQARLGLSQLAWSPLAQGVLTGKHRAGATHALRAPSLAAAVITGATRVEQLEENAAASELALPPAAVRRLERLFPV